MALRVNRHIIRLIPVIVALLLIAPSFSQNPKGLKKTEEETFSSGKTRALIIGISKYQFIDSLEFADRDATVFADYLRSNSFWNVDKEEITLLTNDKAKNGDMITQLARIAQVSQPGDNLLFYFSGHGDVETITQFNNGYLLAYDTYSNNYIAGALPISFLKELFVTLLNKEVRIILVTDACRSGKLAGGMKGAEFAASAISAMWKNEIKILSSQPGQLSFEDRKWGNGRGVFSYYLINGLNGEADANRDSSITLAELEMYVGSNVAKETGNKQQPIFEGPNKFSTIIAKVIRPFESIKSKPAGNAVNPQQQKWMVTDDSCTQYYREMSRAIHEKQFDPLISHSAVALYRKIKLCTNDRGFILRANSELLAALMNSAQEIVNNSFVGNKIAGEDDYKEGISLLDLVLTNNDLQLPYDKHIINLKRYLKVQGEATWNEDPPVDKLEAIIDSALKDEPDAAYLLNAKGTIEMARKNWTSAIQFLEKSIQKSPGWLMTKYQLGICYAFKKNSKKALAYFEEVLQKDTLYKSFECVKCILNKMAELSLELKQDKKALEYLFRSIDAFPDYHIPYSTIYNYALEKKDTTAALALVDRLLRLNDSVDKRLSRLRFQKDFFGIPLARESLDSAKVLLRNYVDSADYFYTLGFYWQKEKENTALALEYYSKAVEIDSKEPFYVHILVDLLIEDNDHDEIQRVLSDRINNFSGMDKVDLQIRLIESYYETDNIKEAFFVLRDIKEGGNYTCKDMKKLKKTFGKLPEYQEYMKNCTDIQPEKN